MNFVLENPRPGHRLITLDPATVTPVTISFAHGTGGGWSRWSRWSRQNRCSTPFQIFLSYLF